MELKTGDKLYCHTTGRMIHCGTIFAIKGEYYPITKLNEYGGIWLKTLVDDEHYWGSINSYRDGIDIREYFCLEPVNGSLNVVKPIKKHRIREKSYH